MRQPAVNLCRICGLEMDYFPWGEDGNSPTFDYCPCCGAEFGYQDCQRAAALAHFAKWKSGGFQWSDPSERPTEWDGDTQFRFRYYVEDDPKTS